MAKVFVGWILDAGFWLKRALNSRGLLIEEVQL